MDAGTLKFIRIAVLLVSSRLLTWTALFMTSILSAWVMNDPTWQRMGMAAFFALAVFIPSLFKETKNDAAHQEG